MSIFHANRARFGFRRPTAATRTGVAAVEFAVCLPVLIVLILGSIECCSMIFLRQSLAVVAYEGLRVAVKPDASLNDVQVRCQQVLDDRRIQGARVAVTPSNFPARPRGTFIRITVTAPCAANALLPVEHFGSDLSASAEMVKE
jgi:hypothetical protein